MYNFLKAVKKEALAGLAVVILLVLFRLMPHPSNFTPILAAGIFAGFYFKNFFIGSFIVIFSMFVGDLFLGFHSTMIFTYTSLTIAIALGLLIKKLQYKEIIFSGLSSSVCFFLITNFGVWLTTEMYVKNFEGLMQSYILAIPFFHNTLIATFLYLVIFKLIFEISAKRKIINAS